MGRDQPPLFRLEASQQPQFGDTFVFRLPGWASLGAPALLAIICAIAFSSFAAFDEVREARGIVAPASGVARISAQNGGAVTAVLVRQGQFVPKGAPLLRVSSGAVLPSGISAPAHLMSSYHRERESRIRQREAQRSQAAMERERTLDEAAEYAEAAAILNEQIGVQQQRLQTNEDRLDDLAALRERGFVSETRVRVQQEAVLALVQDLLALRERRSAAAHKARQANLRASALASQLSQSEAQFSTELTSLERQVTTAQAASEATIVSPVAGIVSALRVGPGATVSPSEQLVAVVPLPQRLEALLFVSPSSAGLLQRGQPVALRFDAFPYQHHGLGIGRIVDIATSASSETETADPTYRVRVQILNPNEFRLQSDMTLSASITLRRQTLFSWLFHPLLRPGG